MTRPRRRPSGNPGAPTGLRGHPGQYPALAKLGILAKKAGIRVRMITGDYAVTAAAVARQLGVDGTVITGAEFGAMSEEDARAAIDGIGMIARVTPEHKVRLVDVLRNKGQIVVVAAEIAKRCYGGPPRRPSTPPAPPGRSRYPPNARRVPDIALVVRGEAGVGGRRCCATR